MRKKFTNLLAEYGVVALVLHYVIFAIVLVGSYLAIRSGWSPAGVTAKAGSWGAAYLFTKIVQIPRMAATAAMTPFVARGWERMTGRKAMGITFQGGARPAADATDAGSTGQDQRP